MHSCGYMPQIGLLVAQQTTLSRIVGVLAPNHVIRLVKKPQSLHRVFVAASPYWQEAWAKQSPHCVSLVQLEIWCFFDSTGHIHTCEVLKPQLVLQYLMLAFVDTVLYTDVEWSWTHLRSVLHICFGLHAVPDITQTILDFDHLLSAAGPTDDEYDAFASIFRNFRPMSYV